MFAHRRPAPLAAEKALCGSTKLVRPILTGRSCYLLCPYSYWVGGLPLCLPGSSTRVDVRTTWREPTEMGTRQESGWFG